MAEPNFTPGPYLMSAAPGPRAPGPDAEEPPPVFPPAMGGYSSPSSSYPYESGYPPQFPPARWAVHPSDSREGASYYQPGRHPQYQPFPPPVGFATSSLFHSPPPPFHNGLAPASSASSHHRSQQVLSGPPPDLSEHRNRADLPRIMEPNVASAPLHYLPYPTNMVPTQSPAFGFGSYPGRRPGQTMPAPTAPQSDSFGTDSMPPGNPGRGPSRGANGGSYDPPRPSASPHRRTSYERQPQPYAPSISGVRPLPGAYGRRSDRSVSPRTSHRRSFDRYSTDLPSPSAESEEASRARQIQRRRIRERAFAVRHSHYPTGPNTPSPGQMQALKDKLRHFLPSELPEGSSTCCDICQKDYSVKHCLPTEDQEVAIQLPCKHLFGEHCINTWFETCKTHKNKITCPMCRTLLVEPMRSSAALFTAMPEMVAFFTRTLDRGGMSTSEHQELVSLMRARGLEGDF